jgi:hypothetical protein
VKLKRLAAVAAPVGAAVLGSGFLAAPPAGASPEANASPDTGSIICNGDLCAQTVCYDKANDSYHMNAWAYTRSFFGHFELQAPYGFHDGKSYENSYTSIWPAGGTHYTFTGEYAGSGKYTMTAWSGPFSGHYYKIGQLKYPASANNEPAC